jgi:hypothetical protein
VAGWGGGGLVWVGLALNLGRAEARPYIYFGEWGRNATASEGRLYNLLDFGWKDIRLWSFTYPYRIGSG